MILAIDVGNTETTIGLFRGEEVVEHWRITTDLSRTADDIGILLRSLLSNVAEARVTDAAIGSVVPLITAPLVEACTKWLGVSAIVVDASSALPIKLDVLEPLSVGAD